MDKKWIKVGGEDGYPVAWNYKDEQSLVGEFVEAKLGVGAKGDLNFYTIKKEDGTQVSVLGSVVLDRRLAEFKEGDSIRIDYLGDERNKAGREYHNYAVYKEDDGIPVVEDN